MRDAALLMADTRPPRPIPRRSSELSYVQMAAWVNWRYACAHGYGSSRRRLRPYGDRGGATRCLPRLRLVVPPGRAEPRERARHRGPGGADRDPAVYFAWDLPFSRAERAAR